MKFESIITAADAPKFAQHLKKRPVLVKLFSPSCGHCIAMAPAWSGLKKNKNMKNYDIAIIEVQGGEALDAIQATGVKSYQGFPTIRQIHMSGEAGAEYNGNRSTDDMVNFIISTFKDRLVKIRKTHKRKAKKGKTHKRKAKKGKTPPKKTQKNLLV